MSRDIQFIRHQSKIKIQYHTKMNIDARGTRKRDIPAYRIDLFLHVEHCASKRGMPCEMSRLAYLVAVQAMPHLAAKIYFRNKGKTNK